MRPEPFARDHTASVERKADRGIMPKSLDALLAWYIGAVAEELPERLHKGEVWTDRVSWVERGQGVMPAAGSALGAPAYSGGMRLVLEAPVTATDEDGSFLRPVFAALDKMTRDGYADQADDLKELAMCSGDWQRMATRKGWKKGQMAFYLHNALEKLWFSYLPQERARRVA